MVETILPLRLEDASLARRGKMLVGPVTLSLGGQGITTIIGANGSGKTSLLRLMHGLDRPSTGSVKWNAPLEEARRAQAFVFQQPIILRRSVIDNLAFPLRLRGMPRKAARDEAREALAQMGLDAAGRRDATTLSGGERQKLALARALITTPQVLFLDEPCSNIDGFSTRDIEQTLREAASGGTRIVMATHDLAQVRRLADEIIYTHKGKVEPALKAADFLANPPTQQAIDHLAGDIVL